MRDTKDLINIDRMPTASRLKSIQDVLLHGKPHYNMFGLVEENVLSWLFRNLWNLGNTHYRYGRYLDQRKGGIFKIIGDGGEPAKIALLSDWASDTPESHLIAAQCGQQDYSIHMGDTYFVGNDKEIAYNFSRMNGSWPYGSLGSFAMLGNHEMYSGGKSYFTQLLPFMGIYEPGTETVLEQQRASYFCLENKYWRIIALDTGYYSLKGWLGLKPDENLKLHPEQEAWLRDVVRLGDPDDKRGIIILSHHQSLSAFESEFPYPMQTISSLIGAGRKIIWLWGHEHWCSVYGANPMHHGSTVYARCIGNSGMPVELNHQGQAKAPKTKAGIVPAYRNLVMYDKRQREKLGDIQLGHNGYVILGLSGDELAINYYDDNFRQPKSRPTLRETWRIDLGTGQLGGMHIEDFTTNDEFSLSRFNGNINEAIR